MIWPIWQSRKPSPQHTVSPAVEPTTEEGDEEAAQDEQDENDETEPLVTEHQDVQYHLMTDSPPPSRSRTASRHMNCLVTACTVCYVLSLVGIGLFVFGSMRYFPKVPQYNVCNDAVAWKSLVDSMTSVKMEASFEILVSIMNPNHFDVALDMGKGDFKHDGVFVGTFEIPPTTVKSMAISDMTILAKFLPSKWEALSLTAEYYKGTLTLEIDSEASVRIPSLLNYTYEAHVANMRVHVNDPSLMDRHLCACPQWKDAKNKTRPPQAILSYF